MALVLQACQRTQGKTCHQQASRRSHLAQGTTKDFEHVCAAYHELDSHRPLRKHAPVALDCGRTSNFKLTALDGKLNVWLDVDD